MAALFLETFNFSLDGVWTNTNKVKNATALSGHEIRWPLKVPFNPNHPVVPTFPCKGKASNLPYTTGHSALLDRLLVWLFFTSS